MYQPRREREEAAVTAKSCNAISRRGGSAPQGTDLQDKLAVEAEE